MIHYKLKSKSKRTAAKSLLLLSSILSFLLICVFLWMLNKKDTPLTTKSIDTEPNKVKENIKTTKTQDLDDNLSLSDISESDFTSDISILSTNLPEYNTPTTIESNSTCSNIVTKAISFQSILSLNTNKEDTNSGLTSILSTAEMLILYKQILDDCYDSSVRDKILFDKEIIFIIKDRINLFLNKSILGNILSLIQELLKTLHVENHNNDRNILSVYNKEISEIDLFIHTSIGNINIQKDTLLEIYEFIIKLKGDDINTLFRQSKYKRTAHVDIPTFRIYTNILPTILHVKILTYFYDIYVDKNNSMTIKLNIRNVHTNDKVKQYLTKYKSYMENEVKELMIMFNKVHYYYECKEMIGIRCDKIPDYQTILNDLSTSSYKTMNTLLEVSKGK